MLLMETITDRTVSGGAEPTYDELKENNRRLAHAVADLEDENRELKVRAEMESGQTTYRELYEDLIERLLDLIRG